MSGVPLVFGSFCVLTYECFLFQEGGRGYGEYAIENGLITFELGELVIKRIFYRSMSPLHDG